MEIQKVPCSMRSALPSPFPLPLVVRTPSSQVAFAAPPPCLFPPHFPAARRQQPTPFPSIPVHTSVREWGERGQAVNPSRPPTSPVHRPPPAPPLRATWLR